MTKKKCLCISKSFVWLEHGMTNGKKINHTIDQHENWFDLLICESFSTSHCCLLGKITQTTKLLMRNDIADCVHEVGRKERIG